jgi:hypothetical protein
MEEKTGNVLFHGPPISTKINTPPESRDEPDMQGHRQGLVYEQKKPSRVHELRKTMVSDMILVDSLICILYIVYN